MANVKATMTDIRVIIREYEEYLKATDNPYGYTQFKAIIQEYEKNHDYKYHNLYEPGREMQFDFAGDNLWIVDKETGEAIQAIEGSERGLPSV